VRTILTAAAVAVMLAGVPGAATAQDEPIYKAGKDVAYPVLVKEVKPKYTESAMRRKVQGTVEISAVVRKDGKVGTMQVIRPLDEELDVQAMDALKQWEFKPGTKDGEPVNVEVQIELTFTLRGGPGR
jgi:TonB family protein